MDDIEKTLSERGARYGSFESHARITQAIKRVMVDTPQWQNLSDPQKESLEMVAHKIGRILNGDPNYLDSWVDIEGYVHLVVEVLTVKAKKPEEADTFTDEFIACMNPGLITAEEPAPEPTAEPAMQICPAWETCTADISWETPCYHKIPHKVDIWCRLVCDLCGTEVACRDITPEDYRRITLKAPMDHQPDAQPDPAPTKDQICPSWKQCKNDGCDHKIPHAAHPHCQNPCHLGDLMEPGVICRKMRPAEIALFRDAPKGDA